MTATTSYGKGLLMDVYAYSEQILEALAADGGALEDFGDLLDDETTEFVRPATRDEMLASLAAEPGGAIPLPEDPTRTVYVVNEPEEATS